VPQVDETLVSSVEREGDGFVVRLADGRDVSSSTTVLAVGLKYYANIPPEYSHLPDGLVSHSFEHSDFKRFAGKRVAMIGGGQSAVEYSALLNEAGASVHLITRRPICWLRPDPYDERTFIDQLWAPRAGIAPGWVPWSLEAFPYFFHRLPQRPKDWFMSNNYGPAANCWLRDRVLGKVQLHESRTVLEIQRAGGGGADLKLSDGQKVQVDHVILGTGYRVSFRRLPMLSDELQSRIRVESGAPVLNPWFETSVPGLYVVGLTSVRSFGPLYRFVVGTKAAAPRVATAVARRVRAAKKA
jgi:thioredoxin reductase